jgi:hypothetical protein
MMFDLTPAKKLLVLLSTVATAFAFVLCGAALLSKRFAPEETSAGPVFQAPLVPVVAAAVPLPTKPLAGAPNPVQVQFDKQVQPLLVKYCYSCHGNGKDKGDLALDKFTTVIAVQREHNTWQKVADNTITGAMPPKGKTQPTAAEKKLINDWIGAAFDYCDCSGPRDPGRVTVRRLNRNEYNNTVRDLLDVQFKPAKDFPADDTGYGFDNIGDVLSMSPLHAEKYLAAAEEVIDRALAAPKPPESKIVRIAGDDLKSNAGQGDSNDGVRTLADNGEVFKPDWQMLVPGQYEIRVRASADQAGNEPAKMEMRFDGKALKTVDVKDPPPKRKWLEFSATVDVTKPGIHRVAAAFVNDFYDPNAPDPKKRDRNLHVHFIEVAGPFNAKPIEANEAYKRVFWAHPAPGVTDEQAAFKVLQRFATRAYRRPANSKEIDQLLTLFRMA